MPCLPISTIHHPVHIPFKSQENKAHTQLDFSFEHNQLFMGRSLADLADRLLHTVGPRCPLGPALPAIP